MCFLGAVVIPFLVAWPYLYVSRTRNYVGPLDYAALAFCLVIGLCSIAALPIKATTRVCLSILYVPALTLALFTFALAYVCSYFGACL